MRYLLLALLVLLGLLQYRFWLAEGGLRDLWRLREQVAQQQTEIERLRERNELLAAELADLKNGLHAVEEIARSEMGMIKEGETFYRLIERDEARVTGTENTVRR